MQWDYIVALELKSDCEKREQKLTGVEALHTHRCIRPQMFGNIVETSLCHFSDASEKGYGQCSYIIQLVNDEKKIHHSLLVGKTTVTQKKLLLIPRLVLTAVVLSTKMSCHVMSYKNATTKSVQCNYMMYLKIENRVSDWCKLKRVITY